MNTDCIINEQTSATSCALRPKGALRTHIGTTLLPAALNAAWAHRLQGDRLAASAAFEFSRTLLDSVAKELPDDRRVHAARGLTLAGLGRPG
jgi:hypothetical protein